MNKRLAFLLAAVAMATGHSPPQERPRVGGGCAMVRPSEIRGSQLIGRSLVMRHRGQWHSMCVKPSAANSSMVACKGSITHTRYNKKGAHRSEASLLNRKRASAEVEAAQRWRCQEFQFTRQFNCTDRVMLA
jgi:hypothetical protein